MHYFVIEIEIRNLNDVRPNRRQSFWVLLKFLWKCPFLAQKSLSIEFFKRKVSIFDCDDDDPIHAKKNHNEIKNKQKTISKRTEVTKYTQIVWRGEEKFDIICIFRHLLKIFVYAKIHALHTPCSACVYTNCSHSDTLYSMFSFIHMRAQIAHHLKIYTLRIKRENSCQKSV